MNETQTTPLWTKAGSRRPSRVENRILRQTGTAVKDFNLIEGGDRILVAVSGGKDSFTLLWTLRLLQRRAPVHFDLLAVHVDMGMGNYPREALEHFFKEEGFDYKIVEESNLSLIERLTKPGKTPCSICSRLRRGILYSRAKSFQCNKIALGHHRDDLAETLLLNLFFTAQIKSMPPILLSDDGDNTVIRPLAYVGEKDTRAFASEMGFPVFDVDCPHKQNLEDGQRKAVKELLAKLDAEHGCVLSNTAAALGRVRPSHLMDPKLYDFERFQQLTDNQKNHDGNDESK